MNGAPGVDRAVLLEASEEREASGFRPTWEGGLAMIALLGFVLALFLAPQRAWSGWLTAAFQLFVIGVSGPTLLAIFELTNARWARPVEPILGAFARWLPVGAAGLLLTVAAGGDLYPWLRGAHGPSAHGGPHAGFWMKPLVVIAREFLVLSALLAAAKGLVRRRGAGLPAKGRAALFLAVLAVGLTFVGYDWVKSMEAPWTSTMYALYLFGGVLSTGAALVTVVAALTATPARPLERALRHDLGKLVFAFAFFWGYLAYCQYMLVWYTNIPEEAGYYVRRSAASWLPATLVAALLGFAAPFALLISARWKCDSRILLRAALLALLGRVLDLHVLIAPAALVPGAFGVVELLMPLAATAVVIGVAHRDGRRARPSAIASPSP